MPAPRLLRWALPVLLVLVTMVTFWPSLANDFVEWDDDINLVKNASFRGLGWAALRWDFTNVLMGHYIPVTWLTFSVDSAIWGMRPLGYHLTNLALHVANGLLFYVLALRLLARATSVGHTPRFLGAAVAALFFALHPLRAESVAWATERRDVLSGLFFLLTVLAYLAAADAVGRRRIALLGGSIAAFALGLGSKSIVMSLPLVLVALDVYPLRRLSLQWPPWRGQHRVLLEKLPYIALGLLGAAVAYYAVWLNKFLTPLEQYPWPARIAMGFYSLWFYVTATVLPFGLSPVYELPPRVDPLAARFLGPTLVVIAASAGAVVMRRRWPWALSAWVVYAVLVAPVAGIVHSGHQLAHDRYSYLSCLPWAVLVGAAAAAVAQLTAQARLRRSIAVCAAGALGAWLLALAVMTWGQVQIWRNTQVLFAYAIDSEPHCAVCHGNLGVYLANNNNAAALYHLERNVALRPERSRSHANLAIHLLKLGRRAEAIRHLEIALELEPDHADALTVLGDAFLSDNRPETALKPLGYALTIEPRHIIARTLLGTALARLGDHTSAIAEYRRAIMIDPRMAPPRYALASLLAKRGDIDGALAQYELVKRLDPGLAEPLGRQLRESW